ncbi:hypothetical protein NDU88_002947 [Pleurodeles waltl]|uniref:Uncharacterized protein n=1 Tax=Pleurodeles waltl TaxID=8319 RepID=A0AAV7UCP2_PLEWA|nr:hypothetical protein NDU88_002947 [Pleurodeles waltl]
MEGGGTREKSLQQSEALKVGVGGTVNKAARAIDESRCCLRLLMKHGQQSIAKPLKVVDESGWQSTAKTLKVVVESGQQSIPKPLEVVDEAGGKVQQGHLRLLKKACDKV